MRQSLIPCLHVAAVLALFGMFTLQAADNSPAPAARNESSQPNEQFAPYDYLIGEWDVKAGDDGPVAAIIRVKWGPNHAYLWYSSSLIFDGREEPHLEGMLVWNAVHKNLDMLFSMDLRTGKVQEQGTMSVEPDGTVVRNITAVYGQGARAIGMPPIGPEGATGEFRETYKKVSPDKILTSAMRKTSNGWVATFPGSDKLIMTRRSDS
jgi:hypothetical protein